jgi:uncharacterized protein (DUF1800 family)
MKSSHFISQRLGFSNAQADVIQKIGVTHFLKKSFETPLSPEGIGMFHIDTPKFMDDAPKTRDEYREYRKLGEEEKRKAVVADNLRIAGLAHTWVERMQTQEYPLREKMTLFWHNHFVSSFKKTKVSWAMWQQNQLFREQALGNYRDLTRRILSDNAMLIYLDNVQNRAKAPNENLSRELLELFTLGVGNYTEADIKEGARALAGLNLDDDGARYYKIWEDNGDKTYLGKKGNWKADDLVRLIFEHPRAGRRLMEKFLKFFMTDTPSVSLIEDYTSAFRKADFEMKPMLEKLVNDDRFLKSQGDKIKDPVSFLLTTLHEFQVETPPARQLVQYFREQDMMLFNPPNVKGWDGGTAWLSSQKLLQRCGVVATIANGKTLDNFKFKPKQMNVAEEMNMSEDKLYGKPMKEQKLPVFKWDKSLTTNKLIIKDLSDRLVFTVSKDMQTDMEQVLKYDFNPSEMNAQQAVTRLAEYIMKSPEYQLC